MNHSQSTVHPKERISYNETSLYFKQELEKMHQQDLTVRLIKMQRASIISHLIELCHKKQKDCMDNINDCRQGKIPNVFGAMEFNQDRRNYLIEVERYLTKKLKENLL